MPRTSKRVDARERAREARLRVDAERDARDRKIEESAAAYFVAADEHTEVAQQLEQIEARMHNAVHDLLDLRESPARIASMLGIEAKTVRRIRTDGTQSTDSSTVEPSSSAEKSHRPREHVASS